MIKACEQLALSADYLFADPKKVYIFCDFLSIPQKNISMRLATINTLGVFSSLAKYFVVIAPVCTHKDTGAAMNKLSYQRRGWCRLEQWGHMCVWGSENMLFYDGEAGILRPLDDKEETGVDWYETSTLVFEGEYSFPDDKEKLVDVVLGLYGFVLRVRASQPTRTPGAQALEHPAARRKRNVRTSRNLMKEAASSRLYPLIARNFLRCFPVQYFGDLPELMTLMLNTDEKLKQTVTKSKAQHVSMKEGSCVSLQLQTPAFESRLSLERQPTARVAPFPCSDSEL